MAKHSDAPVVISSRNPASIHGVASVLGDARPCLTPLGFRCGITLFTPFAEVINHYRQQTLIIKGKSLKNHHIYEALNKIHTIVI
jgi:hypothetical protein